MSILQGAEFTAPNLVNICIDQRGESESRGRMYSYYSENVLFFQNEFQLLKMMDDLMEKGNFPQSSVEIRTYQKQLEEKGEAPERVTDQKKILQERGKLATFLICVQYRQNASWQGEIVWLEQDRRCSFQSALELLKLMDRVKEPEMKLSFSI